MTRDDARWADALLERVRFQVEPSPAELARNLEAVERRLSGAAPGADRAAAADAAPAGTRAAARLGAASGAALRALPEAGVSRRAPALEIAGSLASLWRATRSRHALLGAAARAAAFGLATGVIGYYVGFADGQRRGETRADARASQTPEAVSPAPHPSTFGSPDAPAQAAEVAGPTPSPVVDAASPPRPRTASAASERASPRPGVRSARDRSGAVGLPSKRRPSPIRSEPSALDHSEPSALREAIELLQRAEAALRRSDAVEARRLLVQLDARAAPELLLEERLVTRALIACELDEHDEARRALTELDRNNAHSIYRARLEGSCAHAPTPSRP